jgi:exodeoxyribonuclease VII large subunit
MFMRPPALGPLALAFYGGAHGFTSQEDRMDLFEDAAPGQNAHEFTVTEISGKVKQLVEGEFGRVRVRGEIGRVSRPTTGHVYLDLKDDRAVLAAVIWKGV